MPISLAIDCVYILWMILCVSEAISQAASGKPACIACCAAWNLRLDQIFHIPVAVHRAAHFHCKEMGRSLKLPEHLSWSLSNKHKLCRLAFHETCPNQLLGCIKRRLGLVARGSQSNSVERPRAGLGLYNIGRLAVSCCTMISGAPASSPRQAS